MAADQYTVSLLHFNEGIKDEAGKIWTATNGASVSTAQSKFGGSSLYLNGSQYISTGVSDDFNFEAGDFTIDWWQYVLSDQSNTIISFQTANGYELLLNARNSGPHPVSVFFASSMGNTVWDVASIKMGTIQVDTWIHYAVCRQGNTIYLFESGVLQNTVSVANKSFAPITNVHIGRYDAPYYKGYIDEFRVSKGIARWTDNFTPPTEPYEGGTPTPSVPAPTNLNATAGDAKATLNWNAVTGATGYNVKRSTTAGGPYTTIASNVSGTSYVDSGLTNGTIYYYVVTAITANGESGNSNEASATPKADVTPPDPKLHIVLEVGEQIQLIGNILPEIIGDPNLEWNSTLPQIASVDATGKVTAHAEGVTRIQVKTKDGTWTDYALVEVIAKKYRLSILLKVGESCLLKFAADKDVIWQSGDSAVATVDPSDAPITRVTAHAKGLSLVTVQTADGSKRDQIYVTVIK